MVNIVKLQAVVQLHDRPTEADHLKRLALFFDEIYYVPPRWTIVNEDALGRPARRLPDGRMVKEVHLLKDTALGLSAISFHGDLQETMDVLTEAGIVKNITDQKPDPSGSPEFKKISDMVISMDINDPKFNELSQTQPEDYDNIMVSPIEIEDLDTKRRHVLHVVELPSAVEDSYELNTCLHLASYLSAFPVFLNERHRGEMEYRYAQYKEGLELVRDRFAATASPLDFKCRFGELVFHVANSVFSSRLIEQKSIAEIVKYRSAMEDARRRYLSSDLIELSSIITENPWGETTKEETEKYVHGKMSRDLAVFDAKSREAWEKLFGSVAVQLADASQSIAIGGSAGGFIGHVIPNASTWELLLLGAVAGAAKEAPKLVRSIVDMVLELRSQQRSSIAYIARFK